MKNHYEVLGINTSATDGEIRRAYRVLARRYHPDVNQTFEAIEKFKLVSEAYRVLKDKDRRRQYDRELDADMQKTAESRFRAFKSRVHKTATERYYQAQKKDYEAIKKMNPAPEPTRESGSFEQIGEALKKSTRPLKDSFSRWISKSSESPAEKSRKKGIKVSNVTVMEVSISMKEAINGARKSVEIENESLTRKIKVSIPPGVRHGTVLRLRSTAAPGEEVVIIVRVARHPFLRLEPRGLIMEVPITISEAINGTNIQVPTTEEPVLLKVPPYTQGGTELRLKNKGVMEGDVRGDLFVRISVRVPETVGAAGLTEKAKEFDVYYEDSVRDHLPANLKELDTDS